MNTCDAQKCLKCEEITLTRHQHAFMNCIQKPKLKKLIFTCDLLPGIKKTTHKNLH